MKLTPSFPLLCTQPPFEGPTCAQRAAVVAGALRIHCCPDQVEGGFSACSPLNLWKVTRLDDVNWLGPLVDLRWLELGGLRM